ncbi:MAG: methyltransferase domain-containing protein [Candidatus Omnitrophica bacterium]|nr:methyltransferase domain-containing protein [Candidatus Omnitrophota bacterium]
MRVKHEIKKIVFPVFKRVSSLVLNNKRARYAYLKVSTFFVDHGISPLLSTSSASMRGRWLKQGTQDSLVDPKTYLDEDKSTEELFKEVLPYLSKEGAILEIGCNVGRSLNYLHKQGYKNLTGIEIGSEAVKLMEASFPEMHHATKIITGDAAEEIKKFPTGGFDLVFCHSVLVSIPPKANHIFKEMARVSNKFVLILESEGTCTAYPRNFKKMFERQGLKMIVSKIFTEACSSLPIPFKEEHIYKNNTIRLFVKNKSQK